jgi:hypothetical protein
MCKEMPVIPVSRVVDKKRIIGKMVLSSSSTLHFDPPA